MVKAIALDLGHTVMDERLDMLTVVEHRESHLMPGVREALGSIALPIALWANTRAARAADVRKWLERAGLSERVTWIVTSVNAGARKPNAAFFSYALAAMGLTAGDVLFVGNQRNTDIAGGNVCGIRTVYLSDDAYRSPDDAAADCEPTYTIGTLLELPALVIALTDPAPRTEP